MKHALAVLAGAALGALGGYLLGVWLACGVLWPGSNLCGFVAVFVTAPIGAASGCAAGSVLTRPRRP